MSDIDFKNKLAAGVTTPPLGETTVFIDTDKKLKTKDDAGVVTDYSAAGNSITALTGEVLATGPGSVAATVTNAAVIGKVLTGLSVLSGDVLATDTLLEAIGKLNQRTNRGWLSEAVDGDVVLSSDITLVRDMYYNSLVVNPGVNLFTGGFRIFSKNNIVNNGNILRTGANSLIGVAGVGFGAASIGGSASGGAGGNAAGTTGAAVTGLGGSGGAAGAGSGGAGGGAGASNPLGAVSGGLDVLLASRQAVVARDLTNAVIPGGAGGGGGGGDGAPGGGGGAGGGVIAIVTRSLIGTGIIQARGGNGGSPAAGNRGGGGGGGGGVIVVVTENDTTATALSFSVAGGLGSAGTGTGVAGTNGANGRIFRVRI